MLGVNLVDAERAEGAVFLFASNPPLAKLDNADVVSHLAVVAEVVGVVKLEVGHCRFLCVAVASA